MPNLTKRLLLYAHYDRDGRVDEHILHQLTAFAPHCREIRFVSNSPITAADGQRLNAIVTAYRDRPNHGYDFAAWQTALEECDERLKDFDEVILMNSSCYGPLFPLEELWQKMASVTCDFWGITRHPGTRGIPPHLQSYFLVIRRSMATSNAFREFWERAVPRCRSHADAVRFGEIAFSTEMEQAGFHGRALIETEDLRENWSIGYTHPLAVHAADRLIVNYRLPLLKVKAFAKFRNRQTSSGAEIIRALNRSGSNYPLPLLERHLRRTTPLSWQKNLPSTLLLTTSENVRPPTKPISPKIAVFLHAYYPDLLPEFFSALNHLPGTFDLHVTTPHRELEKIFSRFTTPPQANLTLHVTPNRGRDIAPWLNAIPLEQHLSYDVALKLHTKKSPTVTSEFGNRWREFLLQALLPSSEGVDRLLHAFADDPELGLILPPWPPVVTLQCPAAYLGTAADSALARQLLDRLRLAPPGETDQPIFSAGSMFYYRPAAIAPLLQAGLDYTTFPAEPLPEVGTIAHAIERLIPYIAQSNSYTYRQTMTLEMLQDAFRTCEDRSTYHYTTVYRSMRELYHAVRNSIRWRTGISRGDQWPTV